MNFARWIPGWALVAGAMSGGALASEEGPAAALEFARLHRGEAFEAGVLHCYPRAVGVSLEECENIIPMTAELWSPKEIVSDFRRRMEALPSETRKKGIVVMLKTERCATKWLRACTVTTAALEKRSTPLAGEFLIYGVLLKPRDGDTPAGSLAIEKGPDAWKNEAAGEYDFRQGPGATLVFIDPASGAKLERTDAVALRLFEKPFVENGGQTPELHGALKRVLELIERGRVAVRERRRE